MPPLQAYSTRGLSNSVPFLNFQVEERKKRYKCRWVEVEALESRWCKEAGEEEGRI